MIAIRYIYRYTIGDFDGGGRGGRLGVGWVGGASWGLWDASCGMARWTGGAVVEWRVVGGAAVSFSG